MPYNSSLATRAKLLAVAEAQFAARGLESVTLSEITKAAGQRNKSALNYHFGGKAGLLQAIIDKHQPDVVRRRHEMLDHLETHGDVTVETLMGAVVLPLAEKFDDPDGGPHYLSISAQLMSSPSYSELAIAHHAGHSHHTRLARLLLGVVPVQHTDSYLPRTLILAGMLLHSLADYINLRKNAPPSLHDPDTRLFVDTVVQSMATIVTLPASHSVRHRLLCNEPT
ncbi:MAG: TetR/AcrR family transcriptional regulator [Polyangiaceae bacterium]|nr:TetR/AcrR family transcriptional regulator [Polyangiaceae bacterium]